MKSRAFIQRLFSHWPAKVMSLGAAILFYVIISFSQVETREIYIPLNIELPDDLVPNETWAKRAKIIIRGDSNTIWDIPPEEIEAIANFSDATEEGEYQETVSIRTFGTSADLSGVEFLVEPESLKIRLETLLEKYVDLEPEFGGSSPQAGYELGSYVLVPPQVRIAGPISEVESIVSLETQEIELSGRNADFSQRVRILVPNDLIEIVDQPVVEFYGSIEESVVRTVYDRVEMVIFDLGTEFIIANELPIGKIEVQGNQVLLDKVRADSLGLTVDASKITQAGEYTLSVDPQVPGGLLVVNFEPKELNLIIEEIVE